MVLMCWCIAWPVTCVGVKGPINQCHRDNQRFYSDETASEMRVDKEDRGTRIP